MSGIVGAFMREFGLVVVFATAFSLLVSFTLTPLLAARWALPKNAAIVEVKSLPWMLRTGLVLGLSARWHSMLDAFGRSEARVARIYAHRWLPAAMRRWRPHLCGRSRCDRAAR